MSHTIQVASRRLIDILNYTSECVDIKDIATHLSRKVRYSGAGNGFYSVAQHSALVGIATQYTITNSNKFMTIMESGSELEQAKAIVALWRKSLKGHLHDGGEYVMPDIPRPIKRLPICKELNDIEDRITQTIFDYHSLGTIDDPLVHKMDGRMLATELLWAITPCQEWLDEIAAREPVEPFSEEIIEPAHRVFMLPDEAREFFMTRFKELWWNFQQSKLKMEELSKKLINQLPEN